MTKRDITTARPSQRFTGRGTHTPPLPIDKIDRVEPPNRVLTKAELRSTFLLGAAVNAAWVVAARKAMLISPEDDNVIAAETFSDAYGRSVQPMSAICRDLERYLERVAVRPLRAPQLRWDDPRGGSLSYSVTDAGKTAIVTVREPLWRGTLPKDRTGIVGGSPLWTAWIDTRNGEAMLSVMPATSHRTKGQLDALWVRMESVLSVWGHEKRASGAPQRMQKGGAHEGGL